jgi:hypothetical protein
MSSRDYKVGDIVGLRQNDCVVYKIIDTSKLTGYPTVLQALGIMNNGKINYYSEVTDLHHTTDPQGWDLNWMLLKEMSQLELINTKVKAMYARRKEQGYVF